MTHPHGSVLTRLILSAFFVVVAACAVGCADDVSLSAAGDDVGTAAQALTDRKQEVMIHNVDPRTITSFQISVAAKDQNSGLFFAGVATVPGPVTPRTLNSMVWTQNGLTQSTYNQNGGAVSLLWFDDFSDLPYRFSAMTVTVQATINGNCHTDWEAINLVPNGAVHLRFDGNNATWNGRCFTGNLLRPLF